MHEGISHTCRCMFVLLMYIKESTMRKTNEQQAPQKELD